MLHLPTASTSYNCFLAISRRQWADFGPPKPIKIKPTAKIENMKLIHFFPQKFYYLLTQPIFPCQAKYLNLNFLFIKNNF